MHHNPTITSATRADPVEALLGRTGWDWSDYVEAGRREFDRLYVNTTNASPWQPGNRESHAVKFAESACPAWKRRAAVAAARGARL